MTDTEERLSRLEEVVSGLKEVPDDIFEDDVSDSSSEDDEADSSEEDSNAEAETKGDDETCQVEKSDGEVCGRERPCPYHDEE